MTEIPCIIYIFTVNVLPIHCYKKTLLVGGLLICLALSSGAQEKLRYLSIDQGLSNNTTTCISRDRQGFMWFGTYDGLNKYDGYSFKKYNHRIGDPSSLPNDLVVAIAQDDSGRHWIVAGPGISVLDDQTSTFSRVKYRPPGSTESRRLENSVNCITGDGQGNMLAGANRAGFLVFDKGALTGRPISLSFHGRRRTDYTVQAIVPDKDGSAWLSVSNTGICFYDPRSATVSVCNENSVNANCLVRAGQDTLLLGTDNALYQYSIRGNALTPFRLRDGSPVRPGRIMDICPDKDGMIWVATDGNGISVIDAGTHRQVALPDLIGSQTITSNAIYCIYQDDQQRKWIGTFRGGIDVVDHEGDIFHTVRKDGDKPNTLVNNFVSSFCEDRNGDIWIGTDGGGISVWNRKTNTFRSYTHGPGNSGLTSNKITNIAAGDDGSIWVAAYEGGVVRFDRRSHSFHQVPCGEGCRLAWQVYKDRAGRIWVGAINETRGLYRYDKASGQLTPMDLSTAVVTALASDRNDHLWIGGRDSVLCIDTTGKRLFAFPTRSQVRCILEAHDGAMWIGTQGNGLLKYSQGRCSFYTAGLCNNNIMNVLEDSNGAIWMSTYNGLSKFSPDKQRFENFFDVDGLQSNQFLYNAGLKLRSGEMLFGGIKGFTIFRPEACIPRQSFPPLAITGIRILNEEVLGIGPYVKGGNLSSPGEIVLPYSKAVLSLDYAALEYSLPRKIQYAYFLEGWDKTWTQAGQLRTANYSELNEGDYLLRIRSTNASGIWNTSELQVPIHVLPPWYRTVWFRLLALVTLLAIIGTLLFYWEKQRHTQYQIKVAELRHRQEMEFNEKRLSFFTNISHEFRSPLTLILNPIKELLKNGTLPADSFNLSVLHNNAQRLLKMTDQLLLFRKTDNELGMLNLARFDLLGLCRQVFLCFSEEARSKSLEYTFDCGLDRAETVADAEKTEIILFNLISNAIKFSPSRGKVSVELKEDHDGFTLSVSDNGPGIPEGVGDQLFQKFYQVPRQTTKQPKGFGIGLYLARSLAGLQGGGLSYHCPASGGTVFVFHLKKGPPDPAASEAAPAASAAARAVSEAAPESSRADLAALAAAPSSPPTMATTVDGDIALPPAPDRKLGELVSEKKVMLIVDDDQQMIAYIRHLFDELSVYAAEDAADGWKKVQEVSPDIVICDVMMDGSSGIELCRRLKTNNACGHIPVILLTGCSSGDVRREGIECGADDYIVKPFESELLVARVNNILKDREVLKKYFFNEITLQSNSLRVSDEFKGFLADCIRVVEENIERDDFDSSAFAKKMGMSRSKLYTKVKSISGLSVNEFVKLIRLRKAAELMIHTDGQIKEIAFQVGFSDGKYFREQFTRLFELKPSDYIARYRKNFQANSHLSDQFTRVRPK